MFGLGVMELIAILAIALVIFGPKRLPDVGRTLGKAARDFKSGIGEIEDVKSSLKIDMNLKPDATPKHPPKAG